MELTEDLYEKLIGNYVDAVQIWEDGSLPPYSQDVVRVEDLGKAADACGTRAKERMRETVSGSLSRMEEDRLLDEITTVLKARSLLRKKQKRYAEFDNILVLVG